jgi:hypothetical protein
MDRLNEVNPLKEPIVNLFCHDHKRVMTFEEAKNCAKQGHILSEVK